MNPNVYIIGMGIVSAIGRTPQSVLKALQNKQSGISKLTLFKSRLQNIPVGELPLSEKQLVNLCPEHPPPGQTRTALLALYAARQALETSGLPKHVYEHVALSTGTTVGGMCATEALYRAALRQPVTPALRHSFECGHHAEYVAAALKLGPHINTLSTACSTSANAIMLGAQGILSGEWALALAGGTDSLAQFTLNGFNALELLAPQPCRPFSLHRNGITLGEGAAYTLLASTEIVKEFGLTPIAQLSGFANANDAYHPTSLSPKGTGPKAAIQNALDNARLKPADISYINCHGTGTANNDEVELQTLNAIFGCIPPFSSTKPYTGHTLGAAGAVEAVLSLLSIQSQQVFPNLNFTKGIAPAYPNPVTEVQPAHVRHVLSNSFGFGGNCTALIFSECRGCP